MLRVLVGYLLVGLFAFPVQAQYTLRAERAGPGHPVMEGGGYALQGTAGQPAARIVGDDPYLGAGFWYAVRNENVALPVELTGFDATASRDVVELRWQTASETNNAGFAIERTVGGPWEEIDFVGGAGTTAEPQSYRYLDTSLPYDAEALRYRLRQVDTDGTTAYSKEVLIERGTPTRLVLHPTAPNPLRSQATLRYELPQAADVHLAVYDALGRQVASLVDARQEAGYNTVPFAAHGLPSGVFFVRLRANGRTKIQQLTILR